MSDLRLKHEEVGKKYYDVGQEAKEDKSLMRHDEFCFLKGSREVFDNGN